MSKFNYHFSNLCGCVYKEGNTVFAGKGGTVLLSPVGNRVTAFDLINHSSSTFPFQNRHNIARIAVSPDSTTLISVDVKGNALLVNLLRRVVLAEFNFKKPVRDIQFSPDGKYFAVTQGRHIQVWHAPPLVRKFRPFSLHRNYTGHYDDVLCIQWSPDSLFFVTGSKDSTCRLYSLNPTPGFTPVTLTGHRGHVVSIWFGQRFYGVGDQRGSLLYSVGKDGALFVWKFESLVPPPKESVSSSSESEHESDYEDSNEDTSGEEDEFDSEPSKNSKRKRHGKQEQLKRTHERHKRRQMIRSQAHKDDNVPFLARGRYVIETKHYFKQNHSKVMCATFHQSSAATLLVVGFTTGMFSLYELPDFANIHSLSISQKRITTVAVNPTGEWLAFGCAKIGQLLVWEWQSETYVLKQQGHFFDVNCVAYSPDGQLIVSGGDDGKVKLWNSSTGFCFVTFAEHTAPVTCVEVSSSGTVVFSASRDGTVRCYDLVRYRNFRTLTAPNRRPVQFTSLAIDPSGDLVCAGSVDPCEIYVWSTKTGKITDVIAGHEAPVSALSFSSTQSLLASASWDKTVRLHDLFSNKVATESLRHSSDVLGCAFRPDGLELATCALDGQIYIWDVVEGKLKKTIEGRKDIMGGRRRDDARASDNSTHSTCFTSLCYSADGTCVLAGGNSKFVCIYEISQKILLRKYVVSENLSLDGILTELNSRHMTEAGNRDAIDDEDSDSDVERRIDSSLPGASRGDFSHRNTPLIARTKCVRFSPTGLQWAAASTEGLVIYSLDESLMFDPVDLGLGVTVEACHEALEQEHFSRALMVSLCLNETPLIKQVLETIPVSQIAFVSRFLPQHRIQKFLGVLAVQFEVTPHLEFFLTWCKHILLLHGGYIKKYGATKLMTTLRSLHKTLRVSYDDLSTVCESNMYGLEFLLEKNQASSASSASSTK